MAELLWLTEQTERVLGESLKEKLVLGVQIKPENPVDQLGRELPDGLPAVLVFSKAAGKEAEDGQFQNLRLRYEELLSRGNQTGFTVTVGSLDCLAIGDVGQEGVRIQLKNRERVKFEPNKQRLGLKIITGEEGGNTTRDFWAEQFIINANEKELEPEDPRIEALRQQIGLVEKTRANINKVFQAEWMSPNYDSARLWGITTQVNRETVKLPVLVMTEAGKQINKLALRPKILVEEEGVVTRLSIEVAGKIEQVKVRKSENEVRFFNDWGEFLSVVNDLGGNKLETMGDEDKFRVIGVFVSEKWGNLRISWLGAKLEKQMLGAFDNKGWLKDVASLRGQIQAIEAEKEEDRARIVDLENERVMASESGDFNLFQSVGMVLGMDQQEWVRGGIVGGMHRVLWMNKAGNPAIKGSAWKAGYFDRDLLYEEGKVVLTHIVVDINGVSRRGLADNRLRSASNAEDGVAVKIYLFPDQTIKVDIGGRVKGLKEPGEKQLWQTVLAEMRVEKSREEKIVYQAQKRKEDKSRRRKGGRRGHYHG